MRAAITSRAEIDSNAQCASLANTLFFVFITVGMCYFLSAQTYVYTLQLKTLAKQSRYCYCCHKQCL